MFNSYAKIIRAKKLGVLIQNARQVAQRTIPECAEIIHASPEEFEKYERGESSPSLPQLELLASYLRVSLDHFWEDRILPEQLNFSDGRSRLLLLLRNRIIGAMIRQARLMNNLSINELAEKAGILENQLLDYELGTEPIPLPDLETLTEILNLPIKRLFRNQVPKEITGQQYMIDELAGLPTELREFITKPSNRPYLELAYRLSQMSVEKLRAVAEVLLEITL